MDRERIDSLLAEAERQLTAGGTSDLAGLGFWRAVESVKRHPEWIDDFADRIAAVDRATFLRAVRPTFSPALGNTVLAAGTAAGLGLVAAAYLTRHPWDGLLLLGGAGSLVGATHGLAHVLVGDRVGIRFTHWFLDGPTRLQPGIKIDYASYLRTPPRARAWMHASGALVSKAVPFLLLGAAWAAEVPWWAIAGLLLIGVGTTITDVLFSVKMSDWKRFRREMRVAADLGTRR